MIAAPLTHSQHPVILGESGIKVSPMAWGMWRCAETPFEQVMKAAQTAVECGLTLFDTADIYGSRTKTGFGTAEMVLGQILESEPTLRQHIIIATKGGLFPGVPYISSGDYLAQAVDGSLRRLRTDCIDLYQIHRRDLLTHPQEVARALDLMVTSGKVRCIGVSNHSPAQFAALQSFLSVPIVSNQIEFSPMCINPLFDGSLEDAMHRGAAVLAWSPLGGGNLLSTSSRVVDALRANAEARGTDLAAVALSWILAHPARIVPIIGSQDADRLKRSNDALKIYWTRQEWYQVLQASLGTRLP
ncbi:aldo/keto reductase [Novosphingobium mathurense]|uniref:Predicted oxidoreductase n=1 Tax=Novosphingobium mathurense TaxID=428990 RepID=A0A1U6ILV2_9SPHN|nr:aldo/keto reductase [Novosphingobium mathurense]SLK08996.1 Predicted oxidoreductase [Novosphingobium mathurense]